MRNSSYQTAIIAILDGEVRENVFEQNVWQIGPVGVLVTDVSFGLLVAVDVDVASCNLPWHPSLIIVVSNHHIFYSKNENAQTIVNVV